MTTRKSSPQPTPLEALQQKGWSLRPAAERLGVHFSHLHRVLIGERPSKRLLARAEQLPTRPR